MRLLAVIAVLAGLGCSSRVQPVVPDAGPAMVASAFMQAVADSNLTQMGSLWGTDRGPAATTNTPRNWGQRVFVMHSYLKGGTFRVVGEADPALARGNRRQVIVELTREGCVKRIPFTMIQTRAGWLVNDVELAAAGVPGRSCGSRMPGTSPLPGDFIR